MNASNQARGELPLRLIVILHVAIMGGLLVALQSFGPAIGVTRDVGLWIFAAVGVVLIAAALYAPARPWPVRATRSSATGRVRQTSARAARSTASSRCANCPGTGTYASSRSRAKAPNAPDFGAGFVVLRPATAPGR